ncbi:formin-like protein 14-like isoform X1 [Hibiscus syriacus]|uniref:Formin-like protein 14-like isoform X1 n=1 Tax=Hibiscus syriacus TaxID=106335 RepID=A0A6A2X703_HIBSY|nr:formin-like protein 14-like isoform X1 [Hibiscus syriacus]
MTTAGECEVEGEENENQILMQQTQKLLSLHLGVGDIKAKLLTAEDQLRQMKSRRKEDSKANARVVEIFASQRNAWQAEEKQLLQQIQDQRAKIEELEKETHESKRRIEELQDFIGFILTTRAAGGEQEQMEEEFAAEDSQVKFNVTNNGNFPFNSDLLASASSKFWADRATAWLDVQYESLEYLYHMKHFVARRESPWKVDGESTGVSSKLKLLEQELLNLEKIGKSYFSRQASDPSEPTLSLEFRTQRRTEFLLEAFRLQQHASETGQKLTALQTEIGKSCNDRDDVGSSATAKMGMKRPMDSIRNNLQEVQRNLEIWLARIIGDLEGILARDSSCSSRVWEYCVSRYNNNHFVQ